MLEIFQSRFPCSLEQPPSVVMQVSF